MRELIYRPRTAFDLESIIVYCRRSIPKSRCHATGLHEHQGSGERELCAMPMLGHPFIDESLNRRIVRSWLVGNYWVFCTYNEDVFTV